MVVIIDISFHQPSRLKTGMEKEFEKVITEKGGMIYS